jgi:putative sterol carrier protein
VLRDAEIDWTLKFGAIMQLLRRKDHTVAQFLSEDHMSAGTAALNEDAGFTSAMANVDLGLQFNVTDAPDGEIDYYLKVGDGVAALVLGTLEDADASVGSDYDTAAAISKGELNVQMAFMTGKIKVGGNMAKVMMYQGLINEFARVSSTLDLDY